MRRRIVNLRRENDWAHVGFEVKACQVAPLW